MTRKDAILEAAVGLFAEVGFEAASTAELARRAGVAEGTIFHHFRTKEGLLLEILASVFELHRQGAAERTAAAATGLAAVEGLVRWYFAFMRGNSRELLVVLRDLPPRLLRPGTPGHEALAARLELLMGVISGCLERGRRDGTIRPGPEPETAHLLRGLLYGVTRLTLLGPLVLPDLEEATVAFCRTALAQGEVP